VVVKDEGQKEKELLEHLKVVRQDLARQEGKKPYDVVSEKSLVDMARMRPRSLEGLEKIDGWGKKRRQVGDWMGE